NILAIHSQLPETLPPHVALYKQLMFAQGPLSRRHRELIATVVSAANRCDYCIHHHSDALDRVTRDRALVRSVRENYRNAPLGAREMTMLHYAEALTLHPADDSSARIAAMQVEGWTEQEILHITLIVSYFNFVNRIALGLGIELEPYWGEDGFSDPELRMAHD
ncbi:MAG: peroxidase-related enzyme, partial [Bacteroidetes bacterium]|nr:peroxidase-related enzyme [Bacteroidota bacterium]